MVQSATLDDGSRRAAPDEQQVVVAPWQQRLSVFGLVLLLVLLALRYVVQIRVRAMEFDQICTLFTAMAPSWHAYVAAVPADSQPPFSHIAARLGLQLPLPSDIALHCVSAFAIAVATVCLFRLFEHRGAPLAGLCSAALFLSSRGIEYMFTLRPYAALLSIAAASLLAYDTYRLRRASGIRSSLWPLSLLIVLAATIHALSLIFVLLPIGAGELLYCFRERRLDKRLFAAVALASTAFLFDFVLAHQIQALYMNRVPLSARQPGLPIFVKLQEVLSIPIERRWQALLLAAVPACTFLLRVRRKRGVTPRADFPMVQVEPLFLLFAAAVLYLAGVVAFCLGALNHYFFPRYASPVFLCGPLLLGGMLSLKPWSRHPHILVTLAAVLFLLPLPALRTALKLGTGHSPHEQNEAILGLGDVVASPLAFPTLWWYATPDERSHMQMITDADRYRTIPDGIPEAVLQRFAAAGVLPFALTPWERFHPGDDLYLVTPKVSGDTWLPSALANSGFACSMYTRFHAEAYAIRHCVRIKTN